MEHEMSQSKWIVFLVVTAVLSLGDGDAVRAGVMIHRSKTLAASPEPQKPCAQVYDQANHLKNVDQEIFDTRNRVIGDLAKRNQQLEAELKEARENPAVQMLARSGHVMNEEQCRAWMRATTAPR